MVLDIESLPHFLKEDVMAMRAIQMLLEAMEHITTAMTLDPIAHDHSLLLGALSDLQRVVNTISEAIGVEVSDIEEMFGG